VRNAGQNTQRLLEWPNYGSVSVGSSQLPNLGRIEPKSEAETRRLYVIWNALRITVLASMTSGCGSSTNVFVKVEPPIELTAPCPPLSEISDVPRWILETISAYEDCAAKHSRLVEAVK
jgi:hypothetical protein